VGGFSWYLCLQCFDTVTGVKKSIQPVKIEWWGFDVVICLEQGAHCLHTVCVMPLHPKTPSSLASFKSGLVLPFWYQLTQVVLEKRLLNGCSNSCCYGLDRDHTHTCLMALCPRLPGWSGTRKVKPIWILLKQETVSGSGIIWAICKSAPCFRQVTTPAPHHSVLYRPDAVPATEPTASKHWRQ